MKKASAILRSYASKIETIAPESFLNSSLVVTLSCAKTHLRLKPSCLTWTRHHRIWYSKISGIKSKIALLRRQHAILKRLKSALTPSKSSVKAAKNPRKVTLRSAASCPKFKSLWTLTLSLTCNIHKSSATKKKFQIQFVNHCTNSKGHYFAKFQIQPLISKMPSIELELSGIFTKDQLKIWGSSTYATWLTRPSFKWSVVTTS